MFDLFLIEVMTPSGHLSNINEKIIITIFNNSRIAIAMFYIDILT